jgi:two-component system, LytTR family, response regulator LytT
MDIFLIEDEWLHIEDVKLTLEELGHTLIGHTDDGIDGLDNIASLKPHAILVDLFLNGKKNGVSIAKRIKTEYEDIPIIFLSSQIDDAIITECLSLEPIAYLTKPVHSGDLKAALIKAQLSIQKNNEPIIDEEDTTIAANEILIRVGKHLKPVAFKDILYVQSDVKNYAAIYSADGTHYSVKKSLAGFESFLPKSFFRVHKEYIVNTAHILSINEPDQTINLERQLIPIGKMYKKDFFNRFNIL